MDEQRQRLLRQLPAVEELLLYFQEHPYPQAFPRPLLTKAIRRVLTDYRQQLLESPAAVLPARLSETELIKRVEDVVEELQRPCLRRVVNATGVIIHTNLGRSPLPGAAIQQMLEVAGHYSNLEYHLKEGRRGSRHDHLEKLLRELTGAEAALIVNNNAGAVLLMLNTLAQGREVIVSRGQLVEIGGSFRMPDVMRASGAILREVGTTNKTHLFDYEQAISSETALLLKVHTSNFRITGFTKEVPLADLVALGEKYHLPVAEDLGSGCFLDLSRHGIDREPSVLEALGQKVNLVVFSGDKLLGGPQAGIALGNRQYVEQLKRNPLTRALRPDKLTLAGLEATLRLYRDEQEAVQAIPTLRMITKPLAAINRQALNLARRLRRRLPPPFRVNLWPSIARVGGGALPQVELPSRALSLEHPDWPPHRLEQALRQAQPPIIARLEQQRLLLDLRTILPEDEPLVVAVLAEILAPEA
ncbi:L-seryl-tRNA(Sec) selenium transferase [Desulfobacca acetoxidans]|uniref:L-seryl-tRNA(Sec) selenium transferase n=1 Tax=Desulfobacca acetoxidans (strain ATCC 700848 / DSM 11109 / ASRB2) TaxID=880072 RepID=F2NH20_DESAR|nr:L-seryl-tRNA(Sec) selenium transferase [Desulfobacca acetoxidans]AEB08791.1 L-seryl-tRNA(Sec) selenium transferase [Desulfobacca acetoxidans DSM 11109]